MRWLHLSDVHERNTEEYARVGMYQQIIEQVESHAEQVDAVFFTGDLAFAGSEAEYDLLERRLITPLQEVLPDRCPIYTVPGNHDVNRKRGTNPRVWMTDPDDRKLFQDVGPDGRMKRADALLPRFDAYRKAERRISAWTTDWLESDRGSICQTITVRDRKIALVGINTSWLCHDNEDSGRLTPGRQMVETALDEAKNTDSDLIIVLGHHPLSSLMAEGDWPDQERVRQRLEQANAIYLHGHLHTSGGRRSGDSMQSTLTIQAPSGFQAADSKQWRNGLMWGEIDFASGQLIVEPKLWNDQHREYVFEADAAPARLRVPGRDAFAFPIPGWQHSIVESAAKGPASVSNPPEAIPAEGWEIIDAAALSAKTATPPSAKEMSDWFDGSFPRWEVAVAAGVQPRQLVDVLVRRFTAAHHGAPEPLVELLTGAGGEGKSAALLQTVAGLLGSDKNWTCLWRSSVSADLPPNFPELLPSAKDHAWIVAVDDAEGIAGGLPAVLAALKPRTDVHFVLAGREADWALQGHTDMMWRGLAAFHRRALKGLDEVDAKRIAEGWHAYGPDAMGDMRHMSVEQAAQALLKNARGYSGSGGDGALLGSLLMSRAGEDLKDRVNRLMAPWWHEAGIGDKSLLDIYAMIAAMHAENQLYLSRTVLAYALGCDEHDLDRGPLRVLRREAMVDGGTGYVLTRHRRIAEVACECLIEAGYDADKWFPYLAYAAFSEYRSTRAHRPDISHWLNGLVQHFIERGEDKWETARAVAKSLLAYAPDDGKCLNTYASALRRTGQIGAALDLLRSHAEQFKTRREFMNEWSVAALDIQDYGLSIWLAATSISDGLDSEVAGKQASIALNGLGRAFRGLADATGKTGFVAARAASGRLARNLTRFNPGTIQQIEDHAAADGVTTGGGPTLAADLAFLTQAIVDGANETELESDPSFFERLVGAPEEYRYSALEKLLNTAG